MMLKKLLGLVLILAGTGLAAQEYRLVTPTTSMTFDADDRRIELGWLGATGSDKSLLVEPVAGLWKITFINLITQEKLTLTPSAATRTWIEAPAPDTLWLHWDELKSGDFTLGRVTAEVKSAPDGSIQWRFAFENCAPGYGLWEISALILSELGGPEARYTLVTPSFWGRLHPDFNHEGRDFDITYPSNQATMQFVAAYTDNAGLFFAAFDPSAQTKAFLLHCESGDRFSMTLYQTPTPMGVWQADYRQAFPIVIQTYAGEWFEAAQLYRQWALRQSWCARGPLSQRENLNQKIARSPINYSFDYPTQNQAILDTMDWLDEPALVQLYVWHEGEMDHEYGAYRARAGVKEYIQALHERGHAVIPYFNGILFDTTTREYQDENGDAAAIVYMPGKLYKMEYNHRLSAIMCPATGLWQQKLVSDVLQAAAELDADGIYFDQIGSTCSLCFGQDHGHAPGGDWSGSFVQALRKCDTAGRNRKPDFFMLTEDCSEPYMTELDGYLVRQNEDFVAGVNTVPLFPVVYSGYSVLKAHGPFRHIPGSTGLDVTRSWLMDNSRMLLWGAQLGCINCGVFSQSDQEAARTWLKNLVAARKAVTEYVVFGQMLKPPQITTDLPKVNYFDQVDAERAGGMLDPIWRLRMEKSNADNYLPAVMSSAFAAADGQSMVLIFVNLVDADCEVEVACPLPAGYPAEGTARAFYPADLAPIDYQSGIFRAKLMVPARNAAVWRIAR